MEIEKVIRIVAVFLAIAAIGIRIASHVMFPESSLPFIPVMIPICIGVLLIWRDTQRKTKEHTNE